MFTIRQAQLSVFNNLFLAKFLEKSKAHLKDNFPDWAAEKDEPQLEKFMYKMIDYGNKLQVSKEINLLRLMHFFVQYELTFPVIADLEKYLKEDGADEDLRVENFYLALASGRYTLTPLDLDTEGYIVKNHKDNTWIRTAIKLGRI